MGELIGSANKKFVIEVLLSNGRKYKDINLIDPPMHIDIEVKEVIVDS